MYVASMRKSFKDSLKVLEADIQHANTLASDFPREYDGACLQMRMSYSPAAHLFLFLVQWTDCHLAGALGLLRILIYKVYVDGTTTMSTHERKASIREFYAVIYPSLLQLQKGVTDTEDKKQKAVCMERYRRRDDEEYRQSSDIDIERDDECGICMEMNSKIVLPNCNHAMCLKCYRDWRTVSQSCPFCRDSLKRVNSGDLWVFTDRKDVVDMATVTRENLRRLFMYIDKLPLIVPDSLFDTYDSHLSSTAESPPTTITNNPSPRSEPCNRPHCKPTSRVRTANPADLLAGARLGHVLARSPRLLAFKCPRNPCRRCSVTSSPPEFPRRARQPSNRPLFSTAQQPRSSSPPSCCRLRSPHARSTSLQTPQRPSAASVATSLFCCHLCLQGKHRLDGFLNH